LSRRRIRIKGPQRRDDDAGLVEIRRERGPLSKRRVSICIATGDDVERRSRAGDHEGADVDAVRSLIITTAVHETQRAVWRARILVTKIVSIEGRSAGAGIGVSRFI